MLGNMFCVVEFNNMGISEKKNEISILILLYYQTPPNGFDNVLECILIHLTTDEIDFSPLPKG